MMLVLSGADLAGQQINESVRAVQQCLMQN